MPRSRDAAKRVAAALSDRFQTKRRVARAVITSVQRDDAGRATGATATIDGAPAQRIYIDHGMNINEGDAFDAENRGGVAGPSWHAIRRVSTLVPVPDIQYNLTLPTPLGLNAFTEETDGITSTIVVYWLIISTVYGAMSYDVQVRADDPAEYDRVITIHDDKLQYELQADITTTTDAIPHNASFASLGVSDGLPPVGRFLIGAELVDYSDFTAGDGDTGTGTGSTNLLTDSGKSWTDDEWIDFALVDSAGTVFRITDSTATTLTVSGTPTSGTYYIYPAFVGLSRGAGVTDPAAHDSGSVIYVKTEYVRLTNILCRNYNIRCRAHRIVDDSISEWTDWIAEDATDTTPPGAPTNFAADIWWNRIDFSWDAPFDTDQDLAGFSIYKASDADGTGAALYKKVSTLVEGITVATTGFESGYFNIKAFDRSGNESPYALATGSWYRDTTPPGAPSAFSAKLYFGNVRFDWQAPTDTDGDLYGYRIYVADDEDGTNATEFKQINYLTEYIEVEADIGDDGYFNIKAMDHTGNLSDYALAAGSWAYVLVALPTPTGLDTWHRPYYTSELVNVGVMWHTVNPLWGSKILYDVQMEGLSTSDFSREFGVIDDRLQATLMADLGTSDAIIPHNEVGMKMPPIGRIGIDLELMDYDTFTSDTGDTGTGTGSTNLLTDSGKSWDDDEWIAYALVDSAGDLFEITDNTATTLTVVGTPSSGTYYIYPAFSGVTRGVGGTSAASHTEDDTIQSWSEWIEYPRLLPDQYRFRVRTTRLEDEESSLWSDWIVEDARDSVAPGEPTGFEVVSLPTGYGFEWTGPTLYDTPDLVGFAIYRATDDTGTGATLWKTTGPVTSVECGEWPGVAYYFNIKAFDSSGNYSGYGETTWIYGVPIPPAAGQLLTNGDFERPDGTGGALDWWDTDTDDCVITYGTYGLYSGQGFLLEVGTTGYARLRWPSPLSAVLIAGVPDGIYTLSFYMKPVDNTIANWVADTYTLVLQYDTSTAIGIPGGVTTETPTMFGWSYEAVGDGWYRVWANYRWEADLVTYPNHIFLTFLTGWSLDNLTAGDQAYVDRFQWEPGGLAPSTFSLTPVFTGLLGGLSLDTSGIVSAGIAVDKNGLIASDILVDDNNVYDVGDATNKLKDLYLAGDASIGDQATADRVQVGSPTSGPASGELAVEGDIVYEGSPTVVRDSTEYPGRILVNQGIAVLGSNTLIDDTNETTLISKSVTVPSGGVIKIEGMIDITPSTWTGSSTVTIKTMFSTAPSNGVQYRSSYHAYPTNRGRQTWAIPPLYGRFDSGTTLNLQLKVEIWNTNMELTAYDSWTYLNYEIFA